MSARITIITAPAGAGKSRALISGMAKKLAAGNSRSVLMLLPTASAARAAVGGLLEKVEGVLPLPVANFYELVARILERNRSAGREISAAERNILLEHIIGNLDSRGKVRYFKPLLGFKGFASAMGDFIKELKQNTITPEQFLQSAGRGKSGKGAEIGAIYDEYQRILKRGGLYDTEGKLWRVRDLIKDGRTAPYETIEDLFIDNFANFTPSEFDIIKALSARVKSITFAFTFEDGARRSELFKTTAATIALIEKEFPGALKAPLETPPAALGALGVLQQNLFAHIAEASAGDDRIRIIGCPNRASEVAEIGREIRALRAEGRKPDEIVVIARSLANYAPLFEEIFREQGVPFSISRGKRLAETAVVRSLMHLLEIPQEDFSRHAVMRFLGSPYARAIIGDFDAAAVDRVSIEAQITAGLDSWRARIRSRVRYLEDLIASPDTGEDLPEEPEKLQQRLNDATRAGDFLDGLLTRLAALTRSATIAGFVERVLALAEAAPLRDACVDPALPLNTSEEAAALRLFCEELRRLAAFSEPLGSADEPVAYEDFLRCARFLLETTIDAARAKPDGRVRILDVTEARGLFFPVVFVCGLVEKEFPRQIPQSPFYNDAARKELNRAGGIFLSERSAGQKFEMFLFYTAVTRATERLYLTHPLVDPEGREAMPSYYLTEVARLFNNAREMETKKSLAEVLPPHENAASPREMLASLLFDGVNSTRPEKLLREHLSPPAKRETPPLLLLSHSLAATHDRESADEYGKFDGVISDEKIRAQIEAAMRGSVLSPSRLSLYGRCPFRYFAERILGLQEIIEPEDELTSVNRGKFFHAILREFFVKLRDAGSTVITEQNLSAAAELLEQMAHEHFERIRKSGAVANEAVFAAEQNEILEILRAFVGEEAKTNEKNPSEPARFETAFGFEKPLKWWDAASTPMPLVIKGGKFPIRIRGIIDRLDRAKEGWIVIDYKSGSYAPTKSNYSNGSDLQLPLYAIAVNELFSDGGERIVDGFYYLLKETRRRGRFLRDEPKIPELYEIVKEHAIKHVAGICAGRFPPEPRDDYACRACASQSLCYYSEARAERKSTEENEPD